MRNLAKLLIGAVLLAALATAVFLTRERWLPWFSDASAPSAHDDHPHGPEEDPAVLQLSAQARKNLGLVTEPLELRTYWKTIQIPGAIVDRPGISDRGVAAPATAVVAKVHAFPGDTVQPGERLFTLRLISEYLQNTQSELFKTTREHQVVKEQYDRLEKLTKGGAVPQAKLIELEGQLKRIAAALQSHRQDLLTRGLTPSQVEGIEEGKFVSEIEVTAPEPIKTIPVELSEGPVLSVGYEVQELKVELGQQVNAGQVLCLLANHHLLYVEGRSFRREAPLLERAAENGWPVRVEFAEDDRTQWPARDQTLRIRHLANTVDPVSRTFAFYLPLENQSRTYEKEGRTFLVWRYRPGQRVQLFVPVEKMTDVYVLPAEAIAREGPETYVFIQDGDLFHREPVHVLYEDRDSVVIAANADVTQGQYVARNAAASLNRVLKAQSAMGLAPGVHVHPDGTVHGAH